MNPGGIFSGNNLCATGDPMHVIKAALLIFTCILFITLTGCVGMQSLTSPSNPPPGSSSSDSDPAEIHVTEYLYTAGGHSISGFNINHDGTLTPLHVIMAMIVARDGTIYATTIYPFTLLKVESVKAVR